MRKFFIILLILPLFLSGCWDKKEINSRLFISTIGIDIGEDIEKIKELEKVKKDDPFQERSLKKYSISYAFPDISKLSPGNASGVELKYINTDAYSIENSIVRGTARSSRELYFGHTRLLLISDLILNNKEVFKEIMDYMEREHVMNRMMNVIVCKGKVEDYLKFKPMMESNIEDYISGLMLNSKNNATILPVTLNELIILLRQNGNAVLPNITLDKVKNEIYLSGLDIIKDYKIVGSLNPVEVTDVEFIRGEQQEGSKVIFMNGHPVDMEIFSVKRKFNVKENKGKIVLNINIGIEGELKGYYINDKMIDEALLKEMEEDFNKSLSEECKRIVEITQTEFQVDVFKIRDEIEKFHPKLYRKIKNNWEETFKNMEVNVNFKTYIRRIGAIK